MMVKEIKDNKESHYIGARELADIERELGEWVNKVNQKANKGITYNATFTLKYFSWQSGVVVETESEAMPDYYEDEGEE